MRKLITKAIIGISMCIFCMIIMGGDKAFAASSVTVYKDKTSSYTSKSSLCKVGTYTIGKSKTMGTYPTRKGAILVTSSGSIAGLVGHSAIVYTSTSVVESLSKGVTVGHNNWYSSKDKVAASTVRKTTSKQDSAVADWCKTKVGKKYNYNYYNMSTRSAFYCSQLIWAGYKDKYGINLNSGKYDGMGLKAIGPFEFIRKDTGTTFLIYMKNWNKSIG